MPICYFFSKFGTPLPQRDLSLLLQSNRHSCKSPSHSRSCWPAQANAAILQASACSDT
jgi:hypothetical protein